MIRDPFTLPARGPTSPGLRELALRAVPAEKLRKMLFVSDPISNPARVIGAIPGLECAGCGEAVWLAPSTQRELASPRSTLSEACVVCTACLIRAIEEKAREVAA